MDKTLLERFYRGDVSREEAQQVLDWLNSPEVDKEIEHDAEAYFKGDSHKKIIWNSEKTLQAIHDQTINQHSKDRKTEAFPSNNPTRLKKSKHFPWRVAAIVILLLLPAVTLFTYSIFKTDAVPAPFNEVVSKHASKGQKLSIYLPDGTKVILNSESEIHYPADFGDRERAVSINGEAFFEVTKDPSRPFIVQAPTFQTIVLGTSFNISAKPEGSDNTISLKTGKILVKTETISSSTDDGIYLVPGEMLTINSKNNTSEVSDFDEELVFGWTRNTLAFKDEPLEHVFARLAVWYGVEFHFNQTYESKKGSLYSGRFENESLENVLKGLAYVQDFDFKIIDKSVDIKFNN